MNPILRASCLALATSLLGACASSGTATGTLGMFSQQRVTEHRGSDDLLSAGLGLEGLRAMTPPAFADATRPTPVELRRRALWNNWRGIADLSAHGGYGSLYGAVGAVPGREYSALARLPGAHQPHRVLAQVPDAFDLGKRCVLVTVASGSRGVYGGIAVGGAWGLPRGCAVVHTDKGAGTDYFDLDAGIGMRVDGTSGTAGDGLAFEPRPSGGQGVAFKHAHSQDNPEADWGRHVKQAAQFALQALDQAFPQAAPFTFDNTRVIATGVSNGGGAVLRAAELEGDWLDGVVAGEPNVHVAGHGSRALYRYTTQAALLMPCALPALGLPAAAGADVQCDALAQSGVLRGADRAAQQRDALQQMRDAGWTDEALLAGGLSVAFDLWRSVAVTYASAYARTAHDAHPCGYRFAAGEAGQARAATAAERALWWTDASGVPPGSGVQIIDPPGGRLEGMHCLDRAGRESGNAALLQGIAGTRAGLPRAGLPVIVVHGTADGLIPMAFTSTPYVAAARAGGRDVRFWQVRNAQHFDAFLALPQVGSAYVPLLPYVYTALDRLDAHLDGAAPLPADAVIATQPRGGVVPLEARHLAIPR